MNSDLITVVLPCYNEKDLVIRNTMKVYSFLKGLGWNFELLICDDASDDGTSRLLDDLTEPEIRVFHYANGPSRRENLALTLKEGKAGILAYMDMDLSADLAALPRLVEPVRTGQCDIAIGSRYQKGADVDRSFLRWLYSACYNQTIRILMGSRVLDHQCGFKAFRREIFEELQKEMGYDSKYARGWFWDAEFLIRAQRKEMRILEMPVRWVSGEQSSFNFIRELKVIPYMLRLRGILNAGPGKVIAR